VYLMHIVLTTSVCVMLGMLVVDTQNVKVSLDNIYCFISPNLIGKKYHLIMSFHRL
jgi:hypothetical protein